MTPWSKSGIALSLLVFNLTHTVAQAGTPSRYDFEQPCMGTLFRIVIYSGKPEPEIAAAAKAAFRLALKLDAIFSDYRAESEVNLFNHSPPGQAQPASRELIDLLSASKRLHDDTGGTFDPACGALSRLWRVTRRSGKLPPPDVLASARDASGWNRLKIDLIEGRLTRLHAGTRLDFGAIAKGYAADMMLQSLREGGFKVASITAGGDIAAGEAPPGRKGWAIAIRPGGDKHPPACVIEISNAAVSTSGDVEQAVEIEGTRYSHIIDLRTGLGLTAQRAAAVIAPSCTRSDALATALCVAGEEGLGMINSLPHSEAVLFAPGFDHQSPTRTKGFDAFIRKEN
ncbi:MAG: FAD:protein FMN transferase [Verrucomicrobiales bacterium]